jgi:hypothetical protein
MTDRELLELAAKAAGIRALYSPDSVLRDCTGLEPAMNIFSAPEWNPLTDDGDAFRLAVRLWIQLCYFENVTCASVGGSAMPWVEEPVGSDKEASARRAIVRAAAAISAGTIIK